jgi:hypothetical protein
MGQRTLKVDKIVPEETTYSVAYGNMAGLFIEAIKELKREIEVLKTGN